MQIIIFFFIPVHCVHIVSIDVIRCRTLWPIVRIDLVEIVRQIVANFRRPLVSWSRAKFFESLHANRLADSPMTQSHHKRIWNLVRHQRDLPLSCCTCHEMLSPFHRYHGCVAMMCTFRGKHEIKWKVH